jgi:hypothetical protein
VSSIYRRVIGDFGFKAENWAWHATIVETASRQKLLALFARVLSNWRTLMAEIASVVLSAFGTLFSGG